jgi:hypothetical protein
MHTGQNSTAPENSLPQLGQTRLSSVFMDLTALRMQPRRCKESNAWRESSPRISLADHGRVSPKDQSLTSLSH